ncbi:MAG: RNA polymerase sigma factor [Planctomycetes bacterium]|nr:RNA polymerase sigma factor [Planctomycetota bacterium]
MAGSSLATEFEPYTGEVYAWAYRILGRHHDALDVVQDVFVKWVRQYRDRPPEQPRGWLRRVTVNRAVDVHRRRRLAPQSVGETGEAMSAEITEETLGAGIDRATLRDDIATALAGLTELQRGVLVAKVYDELTFAQVATELGLAVPTIKTHYLRAVRAVRDQLRSRWA